MLVVDFPFFSESVEAIDGKQNWDFQACFIFIPFADPHDLVPQAPPLSQWQGGQENWPPRLYLDGRPTL